MPHNAKIIHPIASQRGQVGVIPWRAIGEIGQNTDQHATRIFQINDLDDAYHGIGESPNKNAGIRIRIAEMRRDRKLFLPAIAIHDFHANTTAIGSPIRFHNLIALPKTAKPRSDFPNIASRLGCKIRLKKSPTRQASCVAKP